jgi:hypothetical protein
MKNKVPFKITFGDIEDMINYYSGKASEYCHQLGIAGIVIIWVLKSYFKNNGKACEYGNSLQLALLLFVLTITVSLVHYALIAIIVNHDYNKKADLQKEGISTKELRDIETEENKFADVLSWIFFYSKLSILVIAYIITIVFVISNFSSI